MDQNHDGLPATMFLDEDACPPLDSFDVEVRAELMDVDEVTLIIEWGHDPAHSSTIHLDRVHAIALAGEIAKAATASQNTLPHGHGAGGPLT